jgi:transcriptional regulator with XRE-family HTH domain
MAELYRIKEAIFLLKKRKIIKKQDDIAERTGYNKSSISEIINGKVPLSEKFIKIFCSEFGISYDYIISGTGEIIEDMVSEPQLYYGNDKVIQLEKENDLLKKIIKAQDETIELLKRQNVPKNDPQKQTK